MGDSFKALQSSGAMKGIAAGVNTFNDVRNGSSTAGTSGSEPPTADMDELVKRLAKYFPQQQQQTPQAGPIKVGYDLYK